MLSFSQTYIGKSRADTLFNDIDKRYNINDEISYFKDREDGLYVTSFFSYDTDTINYGTIIIFEPDRHIIQSQTYVFYESATKAIKDEYLYLVSLGFIPTVRTFDKKVYLEINVWGNKKPSASYTMLLR